MISKIKRKSMMPLPTAIPLLSIKMEDIKSLTPDDLREMFIPEEKYVAQ
ncbi:MAG: hypothetical protein ACR5K4_00790 [Sodalis sp. (in: enterobacteria)]